ncbi:hypothetical protein [Streptomyces sp. NPDC054849]
MAEFLGHPIIDIVNEPGDNFRVNVTYKMLYSAAEVGQSFAESCALFEDDTDDDDHKLNWSINIFTPTTRERTRTFTATFNREALHTELGGEEYYAVVHHRINNPLVTSATRESERFPLAV